MCIAHNLLPLFTLDSVLTHSVTFLFRMGGETPPDLTLTSNQLCQGAISFKGHTKEPQICVQETHVKIIYLVCVVLY